MTVVDYNSACGFMDELSEIGRHVSPARPTLRFLGGTGDYYEFAELRLIREA